jgi:arylsulfatase A
MKQHGYSTALVGKWHQGLGWRTKPGRMVDFDKPYSWPSNNNFALEDKIDLTKPVFGGPLELGFDYAFYTSGCATAQPPYDFLEGVSFVTIPTEQQKPEGYSRSRSGMMAPGWRQDQADVVFARKAVAWLEKHRKKSPNKPFFFYYSLSAPHNPPVVPDFMKGKTNTSPRGRHECAG